MVSLLEAWSRTRFLQDSACTHIQLERICIIKSHTVLWMHMGFLFKDPAARLWLSKYRNTLHIWNSFHLNIPTDVREMQQVCVLLVNSTSMAPRMAEFCFWPVHVDITAPGLSKSVQPEHLGCKRAWPKKFRNHSFFPPKLQGICLRILSTIQACHKIHFPQLVN